MELEPALVKIDVSLGTISTKWEPRLQTVFSNMTTISLTIPFFKPAAIRKLQSNQDELEATAILEIVFWLDSNFGAFFSSEYFHKIASHSVSYLVWILPELDLDSKGFRDRAFIFVMGILVDDLGDGVAGPLPNDVHYVPENFYKLQNKALQLSCKLGFDPQIAASLGKNGDPLTKALMMAFSSQMESIMGPGPDYWGIERQRAFFTVFIGINSCEQWVVENFDPFKTTVGRRNYSFETYRKFRGDVSACCSFAEACYIVDYEPIPIQVSRNPVLLAWEAVANRVFACCNDILGFRKDVRKGCSEGIVMWKIIQSGLTPADALKEEASVLGEAIQDYRLLRSQLWGEHPEVREYLKGVDNILFGQLFTFMNSERYEMKGKLEVE